MGIPKRRKFVGVASDLIVEGKPMAKYNSIEQSTDDLMELFKYNNFPTNIKTVDRFAMELKKDGYFGAPLAQYQRGLKSFIRKDEYSLESVHQKIFFPSIQGDSSPTLRAKLLKGASISNKATNIFMASKASTRKTCC